MMEKEMDTLYALDNTEPSRGSDVAEGVTVRNRSCLLTDCNVPKSALGLRNRRSRDDLSCMVTCRGWDKKPDPLTKMSEVTSLRSEFYGVVTVSNLPT